MCGIAMKTLPHGRHEVRIAPRLPAWEVFFVYTVSFAPMLSEGKRYPL
jgi:hypothetical protein